MWRKFYSNSGLILVAVLAAGVWASNVQDYLATKRAAKYAMFDALLAAEPTPQSSPTPGKYYDFELVVGAPSTATAVCRDKTYSYSASRRGTCSRHGGVMTWLSPSR